MNRVKNSFLLIVIFLLAAVFRFLGLNWDQGHFLHPDERFLNMTIQELALPKNLGEYFDPQLSTFNPRNIGRDFFVYGNFPISLSKLINVILKIESLAEITISGRVLSALADLMIIPLIYLTVLLLEKNIKDKRLTISTHSKFWASLIYALMVLPIQQAHFFTTDTFLNLFVFTSFYFSLKYFFEKKLIYPILAGAFFGLALASKITAIFILPLNISLLILNNCWPIKKQLAKNKFRKNIKKIFATILIFLISAYFFLRLAAPYMFESAFIWQTSLNKDYLSDLKELKTYSGNDVWFPPAIQWMNRSIFFGLENLVFFGLGLIGSFLSIMGVGILMKRIALLFKKAKLQKTLLIFALMLFWLFAFLIYYSQQSVQSIRYYLIIYPLLAIFAGIASANFLKKRKKKLLCTGILIMALSIWPLMFISIYIKTHSRIQASEWIYQNVPSGSIILTEHWDDALPVALVNYQQQYELYQLPVFAYDNEGKWLEMDESLAKADYYILSSNRAWGSIMRVPEKYPQMSKFYQDLLSNQANYQLVAEFNSYPSLEYLGIDISFNDSFADEAFTVYDHPQVLIFQKK